MGVVARILGTLAICGGVIWLILLMVIPGTPDPRTYASPPTPWLQIGAATSAIVEGIVLVLLGVTADAASEARAAIQRVEAKLAAMTMPAAAAPPIEDGERAVIAAEVGRKIEALLRAEPRPPRTNG